MTDTDQLDRVSPCVTGCGRAAPPGSLYCDECTAGIDFNTEAAHPEREPEPMSAAEAALDTLAGSGCPTPADLIEDLPPGPQLLLLHDLAYEVMGRWVVDGAVLAAEQAEADDAVREGAAGAEAEPDPAPPEMTEPITRALQALTVACGALDQAMVEMGLLPPEAVSG